MMDCTEWQPFFAWKPVYVDAYAEAKATAAKIEAEVFAAEVALRAFPVGPMGLTPDAVRVTTEYRGAKLAFEKAFARLRAFNGAFVKDFAKEIREDRRARRVG